jgi:glycosyltransferase involved in cell wall biosynthesis
MRIAIFTEVFLPKIDGITNRLSNTIKCLRDEGHAVLVFAPEGSVAEHAGARVIGIPGLPFPPYPGLRVSVPDPRILHELWRFRPDVVHAVGPVCLGAFGMLAARALGLPVVASYHTDLPRYLPGYGLGWLESAVWPLLRRIHAAAHLNLTPSRFTRRELLAHGIEPVEVWRGGVDPELFHPRRRSLEMRTRLCGGMPDGPVLLYVGRLSAEKQIESLAPILDAIPSARLALVGDGPARPELERCFAGRRVSFLGFLRGEALASAFASADVFVMPSTTETLGFVVLEAMASGCPVVAARAGGVPELIDSGENGHLYAPDDPEDAIAAIQALLSRPGLRGFIGQQARKRAEAASWLRETRRLLLEYRKALAIASQRGPTARLGGWLLGRGRRLASLGT